MGNLDLLREYSKYRPEDEEYDFRYLYNEELDRIKTKYNLETIAGNGDDLSKIKNLLKWIHNLLKHDGSANLPLHKINIDGIIEVGKEKGSSCFSLSVALSEAYLALGFKSKYVRCKPMDYKDGDYHVVVQVYCNDLNKWIMVDPTQEAYFVDEDENILSLEELRKKLIKGEKVLINDDINWNGEKVDKEEYINYMTKNIFRFEVNKINAYNSYNLNNNIQIQLVPLEYDGKINDLKNMEVRESYVNEHCDKNDPDIIEWCEIAEYMKDVIENKTIYTNDDKIFWRL